MPAVLGLRCAVVACVLWHSGRGPDGVDLPTQHSGPVPMALENQKMGREPETQNGSGFCTPSWCPMNSPHYGSWEGGYALSG